MMCLSWYATNNALLLFVWPLSNIKPIRCLNNVTHNTHAAVPTSILPLPDAHRLRLYCFSSAKRASVSPVQPTTKHHHVLRTRDHCPCSKVDLGIPHQSPSLLRGGPYLARTYLHVLEHHPHLHPRAQARLANRSLRRIAFERGNQADLRLNQTSGGLHQ